MKYIVKDETLNKEARITVRLNNNEDFELSQIAEELQMKKSALIRRMIDNFIDKYYDLKG